MLERSQFADLDKLFQDWSNPSDRLADGRSKLLVYDYAISRMCQNVDCWAFVHKTIQRWRETRKNSPAAALAEAIYWVSSAWNARGYGYADSVDPDAAALFTERLHKAQAVLAESSPYAKGTLWAKLVIDVGKDLGMPASRLAELYSEQARTDHYNSAIYGSMALALTPKWGGSWRQVDAFIQEAARNTRDVEGTSMYARLYLEVVDPNVHLFGDTLASWPLMQKGFEDMAQRYPHSAFNLNRYAAVACMAQDKDTFQEVMFRLGENVLPNLWPSNYSVDLCMNKFKRQEL